ncbi:MAG: lipase maturation factor family protein [Pseudomonadales bacterium]|nr:lipase maturation factor family protein [Pseudomonadales bacterium]
MSEPDTRSVLVYDGDCAICCEWIRLFERHDGGDIRYRPYQEAAPDYPEVDLDGFKAAIWLFEPDGRRSEGAEAAFRVFRDVRPWSVLALCHARVPGFAFLSSRFYRFFARHRGLLAGLTHWLWGKDFKPPPTRLTTWLFLRLIGLVYLAALASFAVQAKLLIGSHGLLPLSGWLAALRASFGDEAWYQVPMLFWLAHSDATIQWLPIVGCLLAVLVMIGIWTRGALIALFVIYLSLYNAGQSFMTFQWDLELLEAGFLAVLLTTGLRAPFLLGRWLVFRFMFMGGLVKILAGDESWRDLTALDYHFETQPLPSPLAWYAHHLPEGILMTGVAATLVVELLLPFLIFTSRNLRMFAGCVFVLFQASIMLTGNYNFFNILTIALCLLLFDDRALARLVPKRVAALAERRIVPTRSRVTRLGTWIVAAVLFVTSLELLWRMMPREEGDGFNYSWLARTVSVCQCVNNYGPFAVMTRQRYEIVIEGSNDGADWREYDFWYKPGSLSRRPGWIVPHQPRVDWQMWFAALGRAERNPWFTNLLVRILLGEPEVRSLFRTDPFPDDAPGYVRARFYLYEFTTPDERARTGNWWKRRLVGDYFPAIGLKKARTIDIGREGVGQ